VLPAQVGEPNDDRINHEVTGPHPVTAELRDPGPGSPGQQDADLSRHQVAGRDPAASGVRGYH